MEMEFLRRSARHSRLEKIRNTIMRKEMNVKNSVIDYVTYKQLNYDTSEECHKKEYPEEFGNGVHLGEEEGVDSEIPGCRK